MTTKRETWRIIHHPPGIQWPVHRFTYGEHGRSDARKIVDRIDPLTIVSVTRRVRGEWVEAKP